jgi:transposase
VVEVGAFHLYRSIADRCGLLKALQGSLPRYWKELFTLAAYLVTSGDPFLYCEDWLASTETFSVGRMSSQRISELLSAVTQADRDAFYGAWCKLRSESEYLALDITSVSSYSDFIGSVEWGYNRDHEKLPQISLCMLIGYRSHLPIYQSVYSGSLKDVTTLQTTMQTFYVLANGKPIIAVMDKGFYSTKNIMAMLNGDWNAQFLIAVPFTNKFALTQIESERKDIDTLENTIVVGGDSMRAVTKTRSFGAGHKVYTHVYYNAKKANGIRESLYAEVSLLKEEARINPERCATDASYTKYLYIRRSEKEGGYTVNLREDVVASELKTAGWLVLISNRITHAQEAIRIYREKDIVEKGFQRLKNSLDLGRLRVHHEESMHNKIFIGFIALILLSNIHQVMVEHKLYTNMTMKRLLLIISRVKAQFISGERILFSLTKEQRLIFDAFDVSYPV